MRTIVDLLEDQIKSLDRTCKAAGLSRAEAILRAVAQYLSLHLPEEKDEAFGVWKERGIDSLPYERKLREDWQR